MRARCIAHLLALVSLMLASCTGEVGAVLNSQDSTVELRAGSGGAISEGGNRTAPAGAGAPTNGATSGTGGAIPGNGGAPTSAGAPANAGAPTSGGGATNGGSSADAGAPNNGGTTGKGGASANGSAAGRGGASASGGSAGRGGSSAGSAATNGGSAGRGGSAGNGGLSGTAGATGAGRLSYKTDFNLTESPLSESGAWKNTGLDWTFVKTAGGYAFGSQTGSNHYDDSYAYLSGFPPNQSASAVIHIESGNTASYSEVELLLRWSDSAHHSIGYECNLAKDGSYAQIILWPGTLGAKLADFKYVAMGSAPAGGIHDGDVFSATVVGNRITSYLNGKQMATGTDSTITSGNPGIGFYWEGQPASTKFSFSSFSAEAL